MWSAPERVEWLPDANSQRTKIGQTVTELIPCYYRYNQKKRILYRGEKPHFIPVNKIFTQKEWRSHLSRTKKKNPILEGYKYLNYLEEFPDSTYRDVAEKFNISRARVSQMIALVKKLPQEITDYLTSKDEPANLCYFTERKLRPLTLMGSDEEKIERFRKMKRGN